MKKTERNKHRRRHLFKAESALPAWPSSPSRPLRSATPRRPDRDETPRDPTQADADDHSRRRRPWRTETASPPSRTPRRRASTAMSARSAPPPSSRSHCLRLDPAARFRAISSGRGLHGTVAESSASGVLGSS